MEKTPDRIEEQAREAAKTYDSAKEMAKHLPERVQHTDKGFENRETKPAPNKLNTK